MNQAHGVAIREVMWEIFRHADDDSHALCKDAGREQDVE